ncbi:hypothetical protein VTI74DRAFT_4184 [Chaetomium olivicolor]
MDATNSTLRGRVDSRLRKMTDAVRSTLPQRAGKAAPGQHTGHETDQQVALEDCQQAAPEHHQPDPRSYVWEPRCSHSSMARIYQDSYTCEMCGQFSPSGWLYRCTMDREPLILSANARGVPVAFDELGERFSEEMTLGLFGPDARSQPYSLLHEMSREELSSYTGPQLAWRLSQRDHVHNTIAHERTLTNHPISYYARQKYPYDGMPWMPDERYECQFKVCQRCYYIGKDKSFVSLDGVLNGDVLPTVATGFSFSFMGIRPIADANVVQNLGCRAISLPRNHPAMCRPLPVPKYPNTSTASKAPWSSSNPSLRSKASKNPASPLNAKPVIANGTKTPPTAPRSLPSLPENPFTDDFAMDHNGSEYTLACSTPLPAVDPEEEQTLLLQQSPPPPHDIEDSISLTEEAIETGNPDVVAHPTPPSSSLTV